MAARLTEGQLARWNARLTATTTNKDRATALWDLARLLAGTDDEAWADLVRLLQRWTQGQQESQHGS
ncbi:hypothetical protein DVA86_20545 [Streptomyces armeniacus]|uniref:Uncharacterized protein n=1 Tax=Streptomyces armeniacus TaxID=83291 RepID=A0A345XSR8_9ACTN|nr:hypothetical protein [Streptomyces armeniacus]AXK34684.1 hypothetical protein DVA86_20545 [Streptomyces armeniacus]